MDYTLTIVGRNPARQQQCRSRRPGLPGRADEDPHAVIVIDSRDVTI
jgi:hypothetical protein